MTLSELVNVPKDELYVVVGRFTTHARLAFVGVLPDVKVEEINKDVTTRGVVVNPEGFIKMCEGGNFITNDPSAKFDIAGLISKNHTGVVITNDFIYLESITVFCKHYKKKVRIFMANQPESVEDITGNMESFFKMYADVFRKIDNVKFNENT